MANLSKSVGAVVAVLALSVATYGTAVGGPSVAKLTNAKVKKIAKKQIAVAAPSLSVANASKVGGKSVAELKAEIKAEIQGELAAAPRPMTTGWTDVNQISDIGAGANVVTVQYTLSAVSAVSFTAVAELQGFDGGGPAANAAACTILDDGIAVSPEFATTFEDGSLGSSATVSATASYPLFPAGDHVAVFRCAGSGGTVTKKDAAITIVAVPYAG